MPDTEQEDFMDVTEHFDRLVERLGKQERDLYGQMQHVRVETAFRDRHFIVYTINDKDEPQIIDKLTVTSFMCDDLDGASFEIHSRVRDQYQIIGYKPMQLFETYPVFMFLPLHSKLRWAAPASSIENASLAFPVVIRTQSRHNLWEKGVTFCETSVAFFSEFSLDSNM